MVSFRTKLALLSLLIAALFASPLIYLVVRALETGFDLDTARTIQPLIRSVVLATSVGVASCILGVAVGMCVARTNVWGYRLWTVLVLLPLAVPSYVGASAWRAAFAPGGLVGGGIISASGFVAAFSVLTLLSYPLVTLPVIARLRSLPPSLEDSARLLGANRRRVFRTVTWPQIAPLAASGGLLAFLYALCDFGAVSLLRYDVVTRSIYSARLFDPARSVSMSLLLAFVALAVVGLQSAWTRRHHLAPSRPNSGTRVKLQGWHIPVVVFLATVVLFALVAPMGTLGWWAFRGGNYDISDLMIPAWNSALTGILAALSVTILVLPVAYILQKHRSRIAMFSNILISSAFAMPGIVIALALVYWSVRLPDWSGLYQSLPILIAAYAIHFGAQGLQASRVAFGSVSSRLPEAASLLGAKAPKRFTSVYFPLMTPGLLAGGGLVLLSTIKELPATLLLAPIGFETIATRIWSANEDGFLAEVGVQSLVMVILSGFLTWLLVLRRIDRVT